ncbi:TerD family protein [Hydromonas duriensis]|uniref:Tellurium resistance protein TerD n=1 Tax=Hydromonas duriensis TaxID=1527608 RepID=A0A4R6Y3V9_9BURK|nr:TerD family protein [Hydromonas duriensis]TDR27744.1 tellurium resistance protein TerD [Hydromonas duriensis]
MTVKTEAGVFVLEKGDIFEVDKQLKSLHIGTFWEPADGGPAHDIDSHAVLLVHRGGNSDAPLMYGEGSHFLTYANKTLKPTTDEDGDVTGFETSDKSMWHSADNRRGGAGSSEHNEHGDAHEEELSEEMMIHLSDLPAKGVEIAIWLTIHKAQERQLDFSKIEGLFVEVCDADGNELCRYHPTGEFAGFYALQVGSLMKKEEGSWAFTAVGAGSKAGLADIISAYQG